MQEGEEWGPVRLALFHTAVCDFLATKTSQPVPCATLLPILPQHLRPRDDQDFHRFMVRLSPDVTSRSDPTAPGRFVYQLSPAELEWGPLRRARFCVAVYNALAEAGKPVYEPTLASLLPASVRPRRRFQRCMAELTPDIEAEATSNLGHRNYKLGGSVAGLPVGSAAAPLASVVTALAGLSVRGGSPVGTVRSNSPAVTAPPDPPPYGDSAFFSSGAGERFSPGDVSEVFRVRLEVSLKATKDRAKQLQNELWHRINGTNLSVGDERTIDEILGDATKQPPQDSCFEFTRKIPLSRGGSLLSDGVFLGRWAPSSAADYSRRPTSLSLDGFVAIKIIKLLHHADTKALAELINHRELQAAAWRAGKRLFVELMDAWVGPPHQGVYSVFLIMELCAANLEERLARYHDCGALGERERFYVAWAVARATHFVHEHNKIHLDLRPTNVFFNEDGRVLVGDFGLTRASTPRPELENAEGRRVAAPQFPKDDPGTAIGFAVLGSETIARQPRLTLMPREVYEQSGVSGTGAIGVPMTNVSESTDVFLLGQVIFWLFSGGSFPFVNPAASDSTDLVAAHRNAVKNGGAHARDSPFWEALDPATPPAVLDLLQWTLLHDHMARPSMAVVMAHPAWWSASEWLDRSDIVRSLLDTTGTGKAHLKELLAQLASSTHDAPPVLKPRLSDAPSAVRSTVQSRSLADAATKWISELKATTSVAFLQTFRVKPNKVVSTPQQLLKFSRDFQHHAADTTNEQWKVITLQHPHVPQLRWAKPSEFVMRHPATGWAIPALWRRIVARRSDLCEGLDTLLPPELHRSRRRTPASLVAPASGDPAGATVTVAPPP